MQPWRGPHGAAIAAKNYLPEAGLNEEAAKYYAALTAMVVAGTGRPQVAHAADFLKQARKQP